MTSTSTSLSYFVPPADGSQAYTKAVDGEQNWHPEIRTVTVHNVRGKEDQVSLDTAGFQFYRHPAKHTSFVDDETVEREYYPEHVELIKKLTGASKVILFDHTIRRRIPDEAGTIGKRQPVANVHIDQTPTSAARRVHKHLPAEEVPSLLKKRYQILNLWRPISHAAFDWPLGLCDFRSVDKDNDLVPISFIYPDHEGEVCGVKWNESHRWSYLKGMQPDEFVLFKCFDSLTDGSVSLFAPHTGFEDPTTPEGSPFRESIEIRAIVFYD